MTQISLAYLTTKCLRACLIPYGKPSFNVLVVRMQQIPWWQGPPVLFLMTFYLALLILERYRIGSKVKYFQKTRQMIFLLFKYCVDFGLVSRMSLYYSKSWPQKDKIWFDEHFLKMPPFYWWIKYSKCCYNIYNMIL